MTALLSERPEWGLAPAGDYVAAWGARTIWVPSEGVIALDILHNRQGAVGPRDELDPLIEWINGAGLPALKRAIRDEQLMRDERRELSVAEGRYRLRANPNASCGYLYLVATAAPEGV